MNHFTGLRSFPFPAILRLSAALAGAAICLATAAPARAVGGPESILLVVNPRSQDSLCIANHYAALRHIPRLNFFFLDWDPKQETTDVDTFREKILIPVVREAFVPNAGHPVPGRQIDYVVYSSDFPWGIQIDSDIKQFKAVLEKQAQGKPELGKKTEDKKEEKPGSKRPTWMTYVTPVASINGLTYLYQAVLSKPPNFYVLPQTNWYFRNGAPEQAKEPTLGFSSMISYGPHGEVGAKLGRHYLLSMMLGVTTGRGNKREEVVRCLQRSALADGTHPRGTVYFAQNGDIRSRVRQGGFPDAVKQLRALDVAAEIVEATVPRDKSDVQGAMLGIADFDWKASGSTILPGAICEHFTSFGGDMHTGASQTPLSEWIRYGAAATSGTVTEPYSIAQKFPAPMMHVHYARGCTAAESFYQAVQCPYQLLIVGDPLCRPWADIPEIACTGLTADETVRGEIKIIPKARFSSGAKAEHFEMVLDGVTIRACAAGGMLEFDTDLMADGAHDLRVIAVSKGPLPARGEKSIPFSSSNHQRKIKVTCVPEKTVALKKSLVITADSPNALSIQVLEGTRVVGTIEGDHGQVEVPAENLGCGPVQLQVVGAGTGPEKSVFAPPIEILVTE
jgi:hypothetical protein